MNTTSAPRPLALVVDDEPDIRELIVLTLGRMDIDALEAGTVREAQALLAAEDFRICLTDMRLPDGTGMEIVRTIAAEHGQLPVAVITAHGNVESAVEALKAGAFDFVSKPVDLRELRTLVAAALRSGGEASTPEPMAQSFTGDSAGIREVRARAARVARSQAPVFISGESGTGKELVARLIHSRSPRAAGPFVPVNCGAIAPDLIEAELFGHKKGSFTGAHADRIGLFEAAAGGTLFLDEVGDLPLPMQVKLLRAIQEKRIRPLGAQAEIEVDVRIVSATHRPLAVLVEGGQFRQDLFYRINVIELKVPPLRDRREDIRALCETFIERIAASLGEAPPRLDAEALTRLEAHDYPGNVRELENILERAVALSGSNVITVADLGLHETSAPTRVADAKPVTAATAPDRDVAETTVALGERTLDEYLADMEVRAIDEALNRADGNKSAAARALGLKLGALRYRMLKLGME